MWEGIKQFQSECGDKQYNPFTVNIEPLKSTPCLLTDASQFTIFEEV